jgi:hypothetical protein
VRPATPLICQFIDEHRATYGVVPICRALAVRGVQIAPRTYWAHCSSAPSKRALWDTTITEILAGYYEPDADGKRPPESLYGSLKMWAHVQRHGIPVARRTVERIMRRNGWRGVMRARHAPRTTEPDPTAARAPDLVGRQWRVSAPNLLEVADFTYVPMTRGFGYTPFVVDAYAGVIAGWECSLVKDTVFVERRTLPMLENNREADLARKALTSAHYDRIGPTAFLQKVFQFCRVMPHCVVERPPSWGCSARHRVFVKRPWVTIVTSISELDWQRCSRRRARTP